MSPPRQRRRARRRELPRPEVRCLCGRELKRFWRFCPNCARLQVWGDDQRETGAECYRCGWVVSDKFTFCPWCGANIYEEGHSSPTPLRAPRGFRFHAKCDGGCGGGVQYPMASCPWCGGAQHWNEEKEFEGVCPHCQRGVDDWMNTCPWCGQDATGQNLIPRALRRVRRLLLVSRVKHWGYRVLLRPGVSGVDPKFPKIIEIEEKYVVGMRKRDEISWSMLVGLITHELGHSFLYHNWRWTSTPRFRRTFGTVDKAYRVDDTWVYFERRRIATTLPTHVSAYAATHPQEDFAETFRFYVTRRGKMRELFAELGRLRKELVVYEKFLILHDYVRSLRGWQ